MPAARLGELAVEAGLADARRLDALLRVQERWRAGGDLRRLGEALVEALRAPPARVRELLRRQGLELLACELCRTRYGLLGARPPDPCPRCGRALGPAPPDAPLSVEDTLAEPTPAGQALLLEHRARCARIGPYEVLGELGRGAMGVIYKAREPRGGGLVALKCLLRPEAATAQDQERFRREARAVASLRHEHIVPARGLEEAAGFACIVMDYVPGATLDVLLAAGILPLPRVLYVCARIARALDHAHRAGLVHRDVKPGNVLVTPDGRPFLFDFGIAKDANEAESLTAEGMALGSLATLAPEYLLEGPSALGPPCDIYGLGVTLYMAATGGQHPLGDWRSAEFVQRVAQGAPVPVSQHAPALPSLLARAIDRAVAKRPQDRQPTAAALADDLDACLPA